MPQKNLPAMQVLQGSLIWTLTTESPSLLSTFFPWKSAFPKIESYLPHHS